MAFGASIFFFQQMYKIVVSEKKKEWPDDSSGKKISRLLFWLHFLFPYIPLPFLALPLESLIIKGLQKSKVLKTCWLLSFQNQDRWELHTSGSCPAAPPVCWRKKLGAGVRNNSTPSQPHPFHPKPRSYWKKGIRSQLLMERWSKNWPTCLKATVGGEAAWKWEHLKMEQLPTHNFHHTPRGILFQAESWFPCWSLWHCPDLAHSNT